MSKLQDIYRTRLELLTDLYELTMAYGYWKLERAEQQAVFHLFFRKAPFKGGYAIAAGLAHAVDLIRDFQFLRDDLDYLASLKGNDDKRLFDPGFLDYLGEMQFACDIDAVPEGTVVFGNEPLVRVRGPILQAQILETALLNIINFQTLIATKASRVCAAAGDDDVLEFGLRRAQGIDGGLAVARATYIGGCGATSNVLAGKLYGIPVKGTHAHSWVMSFEEEIESFEAYAQAMPNNCVFLVDTYDTLEGVRNAIKVGRKLREQGHEMVGIRLDSGDLAYLSIEARKLLDEAGFEDAKIVASNELDEHIIRDLKQQGATIGIWGVGTKLATAFDQPALGGVYKLGAMQDEDGSWQPRIKLSEQAIKTTIPGILNVRRFEAEGSYLADVIYDEITGIEDDRLVVDPGDANRRKRVPEEAEAHDLLVPVTREGKVVYDDESLEVIRDRAKAQLGKLHEGVRRFLNPHEYPVGIEVALHKQRSEMIEQARQQSGA